MLSAKLWQSVPNLGYFFCADDEVMVYNPLSGDTHQLNLWAIDVLSFMHEPITTELLTVHVSSLYYDSLLSEIKFQLEALLQQFDDIGLIQ